MEKLKLEDDAEKAKGIDVFVETMEGKPFSLTVKPTTTIAELQDIIISTGNITTSSENLVFSITRTIGERNIVGKTELFTIYRISEIIYVCSRLMHLFLCKKLRSASVSSIFSFP